MLDNKKIYFWQLTFIFGLITFLALIYSYGNDQGNQSQMMSDTMGELMGMHLNNVTVSDLISQQEQMDTMAQSQSQAQDMSSHHSGTNSFVSAVHLLAIATIVILLPFIIAGTVFLAIIWLK